MTKKYQMLQFVKYKLWVIDKQGSHRADNNSNIATIILGENNYFPQNWP